MNCNKLGHTQRMGISLGDPCLHCMSESIEQIERLLLVQSQAALTKYMPQISHGHTGDCSVGCTCAVGLATQRISDEHELGEKKDG